MSKAVNELNVQDNSFYVHPHLAADEHPHRGRLLRVKAAVPRGTVLLVDTPSAIVPSVSSPGDALICSNLACSRLVPQYGTHGAGLRCPDKCTGEVVWCDATCLLADYSRHQFECLWLKEKASLIRQHETHYDFVTLWHVVRLLAGRALEASCPSSQFPSRFSWEKDWGRHWKAVEMCCCYISSWPASQLEHWRRLVDTYLVDEALPISSLTSAELLAVMCKEETNTFGLYPKMTGPLYMIDQPVPRGESYGLGLYPRAARFNHSCLPNVSHQPDEQGRMIYTAARDILGGEEVLITYFDLTEFTKLEERQNHVQVHFRFTCDCARCADESVKRNLDDIDSLPFGLLD